MTDAGLTDDDYPPAEPWSHMETLRREKKVLGFYVSGHPLDRYGDDLGRALGAVVPTSAVAAMAPLARVGVAGMVEDYSEKMFREGGRRASFVIEDPVGRLLVRVPGKLVEPLSEVLASATEPMLVYGQVVFPAPADGEESVDPDPYLLLSDVVAVAEAIRQEVRHVAVRADARHCDRHVLAAFAEVLRAHPGRASVRLILRLEDRSEVILTLPRALAVEASPCFAEAVEKLFGRGVGSSSTNGVAAGRLLCGKDFGEGKGAGGHLSPCGMRVSQIVPGILRIREQM